MSDDKLIGIMKIRDPTPEEKAKLDDPEFKEEVAQAVKRATAEMLNNALGTDTVIVNLRDKNIELLKRVELGLEGVQGALCYLPKLSEIFDDKYLVKTVRKLRQFAGVK